MSALCGHNTLTRTHAHTCTGIRITELPAVSQVAVAQSSGTPNASSEHSAIYSPHPHMFLRVILTILVVPPPPVPPMTATCRPYRAPTQNSSIVWFKWNRHPVANYGVFWFKPESLSDASALCAFPLAPELLNTLSLHTLTTLFYRLIKAYVAVYINFANR